MRARRPGGSRRDVRTLAALVAAACLAAGGAGAADRVEVEAVGVAPAADAGGGRQAAIAAGVAEAVLRVAGDLAREGGATTADPEALRAALGNDPFRFVSSYRLVEDRGEGPSRLLGDPSVEREHAVIVAVQVERARVRGRLQGAGLLGGTTPSPAGSRSLVLTIDGLPSYGAWSRVARALAAQGGPVRPVEFARGRVVAELETSEPSLALVARLQRALGDSLPLGVVTADEWNVHLSVGAGAPAGAFPSGTPGRPAGEPASQPSSASFP